ncbi:MAG: energy transducer TonB [bacterium]
MQRMMISFFLFFVVWPISCSNKPLTTSSSKPEETTMSTSNDQTPPSDDVIFDKAPEIVKSVNPVYPDTARKTGLEGDVWVKVWVDNKGGVREVLVTGNSDPTFHQPAIDAARQFIFNPAMKEGKPVDVWVAFPFHFRLK